MGSHQQQAQTHCGIDKERHELTDHIGDGKEHIRRADGAQRLHTKLNERFGSANAVHINREARNQHDVEAKSRQASLHQVCEGFSQIKSKEVRRLCVGHRHGSVQGCADKHHETSKQQDNRRVIILEDAVRNPCDHKKGNEDSEHSGRSPVVVAVCFFWLSADADASGRMEASPGGRSAKSA